jgi:hypothetical protein
MAVSRVGPRRQSIADAYRWWSCPRPCRFYLACADCHRARCKINQGFAIKFRRTAQNVRSQLDCDTAGSRPYANLFQIGGRSWVFSLRPALSISELSPLHRLNTAAPSARRFITCTRNRNGAFSHAGGSSIAAAYFECPRTTCRGAVFPGR